MRKSLCLIFFQTFAFASSGGAWLQRSSATGSRPGARYLARRAFAVTHRKKAVDQSARLSISVNQELKRIPGH